MRELLELAYAVIVLTGVVVLAWLAAGWAVGQVFG